jgi:predicted nicotinamide N-methyase
VIGTSSSTVSRIAAITCSPTEETKKPSNLPVLPETPWSAIGPVIKEEVIVSGRSFVIERPDRSDQLLNDPSVQAAFRVDEYLPYWTDLWPAARMLTKVILREAWEPGMSVLEIGCGLGLPGIAALSRGLHVTFADCDATALRFAAKNVKLNHFQNFDLLRLDWRFPPEGLTFPIILASDLAYELRNLAPLTVLIRKCLAPDGVCLLTDPDRPLAPRLREELAYEGLRFETQPVRVREPGGRRTKGTLYRIYHAH